MRLVELYFRAFKAFRKHTEDDSTSQRLRKVIAQANHQKDLLSTIKYDCEIEQDWIENIEDGLIYIEKAIREDRQFIRTEGDVIPIEKVKKVSKSSIEHLAKHSNLITRVPKDKKDNLIPEKLYVVEKYKDYFVYENRFLYLLLTYLKDFIQIRLDDIKDKTTSFQTHIEMKKDLNKDQRHLNYQLDYTDVYKNDPLLVERYKLIPRVDRVENIFSIVVSLLATPLMKEVAKAPMITPPVIKTNVLRMNPNFRAALKLYDYVTSYSKDGYTISENKRTFAPFPSEVGDEISETIQMTSNIAYVLGNDLTPIYEKNLVLEERKQEETESKLFKEELMRLKKRITELNEDPSEYLLKLEKRNLQLERQAIDLIQERKTNQNLIQKIETLETEKMRFDKTLQKVHTKLLSKNSTIDTLNQKYFDDMIEIESVHQSELSTLQKKHFAEVETLKHTHEKNVESLIETHRVETLKIQENHKQVTAMMQGKIDELEDTMTAMQNEFESTLAENKKSIQSYKFITQQLEDENKYMNARYKGLKKQQGLDVDLDDYSSKQKFKQLESEMNAYKKLFKEEWKKAKSQIREKVKEETFNDYDKS